MAVRSKPVRICGTCRSQMEVRPIAAFDAPTFDGEHGNTVTIFAKSMPVCVCPKCDQGDPALHVPT